MLHLYQAPLDDYWLYDVDFHGQSIQTTVTKSPNIVNKWFDHILSIHKHRLHKLIIGMDVKWNPTRNSSGVHVHAPVATIHLCVGKKCLIFQFLHAPFIPGSLIEALNNLNFTFVGAWVKLDVKKLHESHGVYVPRAVDVGHLAAKALGMKGLRKMGLLKLAKLVLGKEMERPKDVIMGTWDDFEQVKLATIDAYVPFLIGKGLFFPQI